MVCLPYVPLSFVGRNMFEWMGAGIFEDTVSKNIPRRETQTLPLSRVFLRFWICYYHPPPPRSDFLPNEKRNPGYFVAFYVPVVGFKLHVLASDSLWIMNCLGYCLKLIGWCRGQILRVVTKTHKCLKRTQRRQWTLRSRRNFIFKANL